MMVNSPNDDEQTTNRPSKRPSRSSTLKSKPSIVKKEDEPIVDNNDMDLEDPLDPLQLGDIVWVRVPGNPWWPALIYGSYYEDYIHTKTVKTARRPKKRLYFVYFFGPVFEYAWTNANSLILYSGLDAFIRHAETSVQNAASKSEQEILANRYELKVSVNKRPRWDKAIEEADQAFKFLREKRVENFAEILKNILSKAEENNSNKKRHSSITTRQSKKSLSPSTSTSTDKSSNRSSIKRQKTKSTPASTSTALLHVGLPPLTKNEEKHIKNSLLEHSKSSQLTLNEAQSLACQSVTKIVKENFQYEMSCVQIEWFYDLLIKYPEIVLKYSHWFKEDIKPVMNDSIYFKQCQIKNLIENSKK